jgi:hypothetical protein
VKLREAAHERTQALYDAKSISRSEVDDTQEKLAEARARLLERRDLVAERTGATILVDLNRELQSVVVAVAEGEAKLAAARKALNGFEQARDELETLQQVEVDREMQAKALARARDALADAATKYPPPQLVVKLKSSESAQPK